MEGQKLASHRYYCHWDEFQAKSTIENLDGNVQDQFSIVAASK